ncbi:hypothetical protein [Natronomonas sp. LN261]|jgi:hypothetical protein|uniref:hypothetical protein n=1 Tax=Natronomonas sp. LN261 TaxID=2750669 RepID=UPI0015EEC528|nr:hypothetical protein [Natronomonas sp. LN261]
MDDPKVRQAVLLHCSGELTEAEAARQAGIPRSRLRYYARTSGLVVSSPVESSDSSEPPA